MITPMLLTLLASTASAAPEMIPEDAVQVVGTTAPRVQLPTLDGGEFDLEEHRGTPVVMAFWASWCGPCRRELPALAKYAKTRTDVHIVAVNVDRQRRAAEGFMAKTPFDLPIVWDSESVLLGQLDVVSMPTSFLIDAKGTIKWRKAGYSDAKGFVELTTALEGLSQ
ncbi:MAG: TlpA family protein disulfide reductase [Myxococcota bacterium]